MGAFFLEFVVLDKLTENCDRSVVRYVLSPLQSMTPGFIQSFLRPRISSYINISIVALSYVATLLGTLYWLFFTQQTTVSKTWWMARGMATRLFLLFAPLAIIFYFTDIAYAFVVMIIAALILLVFLGDFFGGTLGGGEIALVGILFLIKDFVLAFPELVLAPPSDRKSARPSEKLSDWIGKTGMTTTPLRPQGYLVIDGAEMQTASDEGVMIEKGTPVKIVGSRNGVLLVVESNRESQAPENPVSQERMDPAKDSPARDTD